jgi:dihydrofolate synthase/folylpolyglutamate synthase
MTHAEAVAFWYGRINYEVHAAGPTDLKLERMRALLRLLGDPHRRLRVVHVTGTKGKGSTCALLAAALGAAGYRVGSFTSPHLARVEERFRVGDADITPDELAAILTDIAPAVTQLDRLTQFPPITFFEISTAVAFLHFVRRRCEVVLLEVGLGGRFDSTNVCLPLVSVITSVGLDHVAQLGHTVEAIAYQKAGIVKPRVPAVSGVTEPGPGAVVAAVARANAAPLTVLGRDATLTRSPAGDVTVTTTRRWPPLRVGLLGEHQARNAAVALMVIERLRGAGIHVPDDAVRAGFAGVQCPARVEVLRREPSVVVVDCAHNVPSAEALVRTLAEAFPGAGRKRAVVAVSADKPVRDILAALTGYFDEFALTCYTQSARSVPPARLAELLAAVAPGKPHTVHADPRAAATHALAATRPGELVCVTGSVFLAGELRGAVLAAVAP